VTPRPYPQRNITLPVYLLIYGRPHRS